MRALEPVLAAAYGTRVADIAADTVLARLDNWLRELKGGK